MLLNIQNSISVANILISHFYCFTLYTRRLLTTFSVWKSVLRGSSCFLRDLYPVSSMLCSRRSTVVSPCHSYHSWFSNHVWYSFVTHFLNESKPPEHVFFSASTASNRVNKGNLVLKHHPIKSAFINVKNFRC